MTESVLEFMIRESDERWTKQRAFLNGLVGAKIIEIPINESEREIETIVIEKDGNRYEIGIKGTWCEEVYLKIDEVS